MNLPNKCLISTLMVLTLCQLTVFCQLPQNLEKGRITDSDGRQTEFQSLTLNNGTYEIKTKSSVNEMASAEVLRIEKQTGNEALLWGGALGGAALLGSLLGVNRAESTTGVKADSDSKTAIVAGLTGLGVAIGVLVGSKQKKYETVYNASDSQQGHWNLNFRTLPYSTGISVSYTF